MEFWERGEKTKIAKILNIRLTQISDILYRKRGVSKERAKELEIISEQILNKKIPWTAWLFNKTTKHPAFYKK